jgi:hypothetical protein
MGKVRKEISVDPEVKEAVEEDTKNNGFCISRYVNAHLRNKYGLKEKMEK